MNADGEEYGEERMLAELTSHAGKSLPEIDDHVYRKVLEFADGVQQFDDLTYLSLRYLGTS